MIGKIKKDDTKHELINYAVIVSGFALSLIQYLANRSLWLDEASIANNIIDRDLLKLLEPLDYNQVAPILFLQLTKLFSIIIPNSELGLRLFPLLSYWGSLLVFYRISKLLFDHYSTTTFSLLVFVFNATLIYYSSELKQYMSDVLVLLILYYTTIKYSSKIESNYLLFIFLGALSVFLSNITPIVLLSCGMYLIFCNLRELYSNNRRVRFLALIFTCWFISFAVYYALFIRNHPTRATMVSYWGNSFLPNNPLKSNFYLFLYHKFKMVFFSLLDFNQLSKVFIVLYVVGLTWLFLTKKIRYLILLLTPIIVHLILSSLKQYPFDKRLILYSTPVYIFTIAFGYERVLNFKYLSVLKNRNVYFIVPFLFLGWFLFTKPFPIKREEIKESIRFVNNNINVSDKLYIYFGAHRAFDYYYKINYFRPSNQLIYGLNSRSDKNKYIDQIKTINGTTWLLFSHAYKDEEKFIVQQLDGLGYTRIKSFKTKGSSAYLYLIK